MNAAAKRAENKAVKAELKAMGFSAGAQIISRTIRKRAENKAVKAELKAMGFEDITVGHGTCSSFWYSEYQAIKAETKKLTGRTGEYDGYIQVKLALI